MKSLYAPLYTPGRQLHKYDPTVSTTVFHWFTPTTGNLSGAWTPLEGRDNWTGEKDWWMEQIKQIMSANIDIIYLHLITRFEAQRINFFAAFHELRAAGYDVPKLVPFLDPFGIWPPAKLDVSSDKGRDEFVEHYIRFFEQYFAANSDADAASYIGQIDGRVMLCCWWVFGILDNLEKFKRKDVEVRLARKLGRRWHVFENGIYMVTTALIDPDLEFSDERTVFFSGYVYCVHSTHNSVHSYHLQAGYWDQNIRQPGFCLPRGGGVFYKAAWQYVLQQCAPVHRIYVESWNEYDEGSGIYAAKPGPPVRTQGMIHGVADTWSAENDPFEYIRATADGAAVFNKLPSYDAKVLAHDFPSTLQAREKKKVTVVMRNQGNAAWTGSGPKLTLKFVSSDASFGAPSYAVDDECAYRGYPVSFHVKLEAPEMRGRHILRWSMALDDNAFFGEEFETVMDIV
jgi:Ig-like domain from next to BRCA1 gene